MKITLLLFGFVAIFAGANGLSQLLGSVVTGLQNVVEGLLGSDTPVDCAVKDTAIQAITQTTQKFLQDCASAKKSSESVIKRTLDKAKRQDLEDIAAVKHALKNTAECKVVSEKIAKFNNLINCDYEDCKDVVLEDIVEAEGFLDSTNTEVTLAIQSAGENDGEKLQNLLTIKSNESKEAGLKCKEAARSIGKSIQTCINERLPRGAIKLLTQTHCNCFDSAKTKGL